MVCVSGFQNFSQSGLDGFGGVGLGGVEEGGDFGLVIGVRAGEVVQGGERPGAEEGAFVGGEAGEVVVERFGEVRGARDAGK